MKKLILSLFTLMFILVCVPAVHADAAEDNAVWTNAGNMTWTLQRDDGTNITVKLIGNVLDFDVADQRGGPEGNG